MRLLAISAWKRSGKDSLTDRFVEKYGAERIAFADPLKKMACDLFGLTIDQINNNDTKEKPLLHMPVLTKDRFAANFNDFMYGEFRFGDGSSPTSKPHVAPWAKYSQIEAMNQWYGQLYWTPRALCIALGSSMRATSPNFWVDKAIAQMKPGGFYVLSDVRYTSEMETLKERVSDLTTLRINRFDNCDSKDPSERDLDNYQFDLFIQNKGSFEDFLSQADAIMEIQFPKEKGPAKLSL